MRGCLTPSNTIREQGYVITSQPEDGVLVPASMSLGGLILLGHGVEGSWIKAFNVGYQAWYFRGHSGQTEM